MKQLQLRRLVTSLIALGMAAWACDEGQIAAPTKPVKASDWIASVNWDQRTVVTVNMVESGPTTMSFSPNRLTFEAGKPYVLRIVNPAGNGKHYFSPKGLGNFYQAIATRKIETSQAEYKAPYFNEVELMVGGSLDLYFVPVLPGTYDILCTIPGHEGFGMTAQVTITGGAGNQLDLEVAPDFNQALATDPRRSGSHVVWQTAVDTGVTIAEVPAFTFVPKDLGLRQNVAYRIQLRSPSNNLEKHYWTAAAFFKTVVTRKVEDSQAEVKLPYLTAVELLIGGQTKLFMVPTQAGTFESRCTIPGHVERGMIGSIVVSTN
jgi:uncharacterized cupredoxin-like copper-binding protein